MRRVLAFLGLWLAIAAATPTYALSPAITSVVLNSQDPDYKAAVAVMTVKPTGAYKSAGNAFIRGLKAQSLWNTIDLISGGCIGMHDAQAMRVDAHKPTRIGTEDNGPQFTPNVGYAFDGATNDVNSGFKASTDLVNASSTNIGISVYERTNFNTGAGPVAMGMRNGVNNRLEITPRGSGNHNAVGVVSNTVAGASTVSDSRGWTSAQLLGGVTTAKKNGVTVDTPTTTAGLLSSLNVNIFVGGENNGGTLNLPRASTIGMWSVHAGYTDAQELSFYNLVQVCMNAINAGV